MTSAGVIGIGKIGLSHCAILNAHPDIDDVSICDSFGFLLSGLKKYSNFSCYKDYRKMIDENDLDMIFIASPSRFHKEMVIHSLNSNIHVFCEKPLSLSYEETGCQTTIPYENIFRFRLT